MTFLLGFLSGALAATVALLFGLYMLGRSERRRARKARDLAAWIRRTEEAVASRDVTH